MPQLTLQQILDSALLHHQAGRLPLAEQLYRQILAENPNHPQATHLLGALALQVGRLDVAIDLLRQAITLSPNWPEATNNLGVALLEKGQLDAAIAAHRQAVALKPDWPQAHFNLANALKQNGQLDQAIDAYRQAILLNPKYTEAHYNLGNVLQEIGPLEASVQAFRHAIALKPDHAQAHNNLGVALREDGQLDDAILAYRQAITLRPNYSEAHSNMIVALHYHPACDADAIALELRRWNGQHAQPLRDSIHDHSNDRNPDRRLRIGYVSSDFRDHVVGRNLIPLFRHHDHQQFGIICYASVSRPDELTRRFIQYADGWHNIAGMTDEQIAAKVRADRIDILVDLALHTAYNHLLVFARKPAPMQITFAGYPGSTGLTAIDYRLSDPYLDPPGEIGSAYSEQTLRLPETFWCYDPLDCSDIPVNPLPAQTTGAVTFGCLNNFCKINPDVIALWARVLMQVEYSSLVLLAPDGTHRQQTLNRFSQHGVDPARIRFVSHLHPRRRYLDLYHGIDIGLDPFPYNGHTTSLDAFWMGVPVVTLVGSRPVARAGWSQLSNLGLTELAGHSPEQFIQIAANLARDIPRLATLRLALRSKMERSPLMDAQKFARNIGAAYRYVWKTWCTSPFTQP